MTRSSSTWRGGIQLFGRTGVWRELALVEPPQAPGEVGRWLDGPLLQAIAGLSDAIGVVIGLEVKVALLETIPGVDRRIAEPDPTYLWDS